MFGMGAQEIALIAIVLILVVGPDDLPGMLRTIGKWIGNVQTLARDFRRQIDTMADDAGLAEERKMLAQARNLRPSNLVKDALDPGGEISKSLNQVDQETRAASAAIQSPGKPAQDLWQPTDAPHADSQAEQAKSALGPSAKTSRPKSAKPKSAQPTPAKPKASQAKSSEARPSKTKPSKSKSAKPQAAKPKARRAPARASSSAAAPSRPSRARKMPSSEDRVA